MKIIRNIFIAAAILLVAAIATVRGIHAYRSLAPQTTVVFASGDEGSKYYRIPALAVALDGTIIAVADKRNDSCGDIPNLIDIVCRRSTDGGKTWGPQIVITQHDEVGYGDAAIVLDRNTGDLIVIFGGGPVSVWDATKDIQGKMYVCRSKDAGATWSEKKDITSSIFGNTCLNPASKDYVAAFAASGSATQFSDGTLAFVIAALEEGSHGPFYNHVCISKDGGESWELLPATPGPYGDESKVAECEDGSWVMSIRHGDKTQPRRYSISYDKGASWGPIGVWPEIQKASCDGDMIRYEVPGKAPKSFLLHSYPGDPKERKNVTVAISTDNGHTWPISKRIFAEEISTGYSSLAVLTDGTIGLLSELNDGTAIFFSRFSVEWLDD